MVGELWGHHGGDGIDWGVLDSALRCTGATRGEALSSRCPRYEERAWEAHRLARMPVAAISAFGGVVASGVSTGWGCVRGKVVDAPPRRTGSHDQSAYPAHAQSANTDERADPARDQRHHGRDWADDCGCHSRRTT